MIKVFNYAESRKGWIDFASIEDAKKYIDEKFDDYYWIDKDNCDTYYIEIFNDGEYEVWAMDCGSWLYRDDDEEPYKSVYYGKREEFTDKKFTDLNPRVDYILV